MSAARKWGRRKPPAGWEYIEPVLETLENEMRDVVNEPHEGKRRQESLWAIHQINWQRTRYIYDMFWKYKKIPRPLYEYCLREKIVDKSLCAKWRKPGFERLCSPHIINTRNTNYGTTSICRVPRQQLEPGTVVYDSMTGCRGCCSGPGGYSNIFGNKYGQYLAAIQVTREDSAKQKGKVYIPRKEWTFAMDYDEVKASKAEARGIASKRKKQSQGSDDMPWLGGLTEDKHKGKKKPKKRRVGSSKPVEDTEAEAEAKAPEAPAADAEEGEAGNASD